MHGMHRVGLAAHRFATPLKSQVRSCDRCSCNSRGEARAPVCHDPGLDTAIGLRSHLSRCNVEEIQNCAKICPSRSWTVAQLISSCLVPGQLNRSQRSNHDRRAAVLNFTATRSCRRGGCCTVKQGIPTPFHPSDFGSCSLRCL